MTRLPSATLKYCSIQIEHKFQAWSLEITTTDLKRIIRLYCELMRACEQGVWLFFKQSLPLGADFSLSRGRVLLWERPQTDHLHISEADCRLKPQAHSDFGKDLLYETNFRNIKDFFLVGRNRQPLIASFDKLPNGQLIDFVMNLKLQWSSDSCKNFGSQFCSMTANKELIEAQQLK